MGLALEDYELGQAVPAVETGTMNRSASLLIQAGFNSRIAAIKAVTDMAATFTSGHELRLWLNSEAVAVWGALANWPTAETKAMWIEFTQSFIPSSDRIWTERRYSVGVAWYGASPPPSTPVRLHHLSGQPIVLSADGLPLGALQATLSADPCGLVRATVSQEIDKIDLIYLGSDDLWQV